MYFVKSCQVLESNLPRYLNDTCIFESKVMKYNLHTVHIHITRCTLGDARSFFLYSQNVFVCTKRNFLRIYSNIVVKNMLNCMNLQNMI